MKWIVVIAIFSCFPCGAKTVKVGANEPVRSLKQAFTIVNDKDSILLLPGTYSEGGLVLTKSITIIGQGFPVVDGSNKFEIL
jgi:nitrous oxidase accessory protein